MRVCCFSNRRSSQQGGKKRTSGLPQQQFPTSRSPVMQEGAEAARFHATTSGYVLLYDVNGKLRFHGGITGSRGHSGDNAGRSAIEAILMGGLAETKQTFVFGCPLLGQNDACSKENQECRQQ